jgi:phage shock protein PspC (stress-responsive transcriptional regulator)
VNETPTDSSPTTPTGEGEPGPASPAPGPGSTTAAPRRLTRSRDDRVLGGVASGIARYFDIDPIIVRVGFVVAAVLAGVGVLAYVAGWLLIPEDDAPPSSGRRPDLRQLAGCVLLGIGLLVALGRFGFWVDEQVVWALGLIVVGAAVLWLRGRDTRGTGDAAPSSSRPPNAPVLPAPPAAPQFATTAPAAPARYGAPPIVPGTPSAPWARPQPRPAPPRPRRPRSVLGILTICLVLIGGGIALALDSADVVDLSAAGVLGGAVALMGGALVVGAWWGRARWLVAPAVVLTLVAASFSALDVPLGGGIGERDYQPRTFAAVDHEYELGIGSLELDLRRVDFSGHTKTVKASVGIGELKVWVPDGVRVVLEEHLAVGELDNFSETDPDGGADLDRHVVRPGREGGGRLRLELRGGIGSIKVFGTR